MEICGSGASRNAAGEGRGPDKYGYRREFIELARKAKALLEKD